ncbi:MAG: hypothetical protein PHI35_08820, partial [Victivallaceae bacterium]|nr:hypothetical protein [Victivallaceae bacterium]
MSLFLRREPIMIEFASGRMLRADGGCPADQFTGAIPAKSGESVIFCLKFVDRTETGENVAHSLAGLAGVWGAAAHSTALPADEPAIAGADDAKFNLTGDWCDGSVADPAEGEVSFRIALDSAGFSKAARLLLDDPEAVTAIAVFKTLGDGVRRVMAEFPIHPDYCP